MAVATVPRIRAPVKIPKNIFSILILPLSLRLSFNR
jgi:hypothetical protein